LLFALLLVVVSSSSARLAHPFWPVLRISGGHGASSEGPPVPNIGGGTVDAGIMDRKADDFKDVELPSAADGPLSYGEVALCNAMKLLSVDDKKTAVEKLVRNQPETAARLRHKEGSIGDFDWTPHEEQLAAIEHESEDEVSEEVAAEQQAGITSRLRELVQQEKIHGRPKTTGLFPGAASGQGGRQADQVNTPANHLSKHSLKSVDVDGTFNRLTCPKPQTLKTHPRHPPFLDEKR
jgi:hypothetical protein